MIFATHYKAQLAARLFPPGYKPDSSDIWVVLGLVVFNFLFILACIYLVALSEEKKARGKEHQQEPKPAPRKLGAYRDEIWIADDFDAPMFLTEDPRK